MAMRRRERRSGYQFGPKDEELVLDYLHNKAYNKPLPYDVILDEDVYRAEPWHLRRDFQYGKGSEVYYFTFATRSSARNHRKIRTAGNGVWRMNGQTTKIMKDGKVVGYKTALKYFAPGPNKNKVGTPWIMHEYRLHYEHDFKEIKEMVLCRIQETGKGTQDAVESIEDVDERPRKKSKIQERLPSVAESSSHASRVVTPHADGGDHGMVSPQPSACLPEIFSSSTAVPSDNGIVLPDDGMFPGSSNGTVEEIRNMEKMAVEAFVVAYSSEGQFSARHGPEAHRLLQLPTENEEMQQLHAVGADLGIVSLQPWTSRSEIFMSSTDGPSDNGIVQLADDDHMFPGPSDGIAKEIASMERQALAPIITHTFGSDRRMVSLQPSGSDIISRSMAGPSDSGSNTLASVTQPSFSEVQFSTSHGPEAYWPPQLPTDNHRNKERQQLKQSTDELNTLLPMTGCEWLPPPEDDWLPGFLYNASHDLDYF